MVVCFLRHLAHRAEPARLLPSGHPGGSPTPRRAWASRSPGTSSIAMAISAAFMAAGGTFYAQYVLYLDPDSVFPLSLSILVCLLTVVGGVGTLWGPLVGAALMIPLSEFTRIQFGRHGQRRGSPHLWRAAHDRGGLPADGSGRARSGGGGGADGSARAGGRDQALRRPGGQQQRELRGGRGGDPGAHRPERRGQEHALRADHGLLPADERGGSTFQGHEPGRAPARPGEPPGDRAHLPEGAPVPRHDGGRERHGRGHAVRRRIRPRPGGRRSRFLEIVESGGQGGTPARGASASASGSAWRWPGPWPPSRGCCSSTR